MIGQYGQATTTVDAPVSASCANRSWFTRPLSCPCVSSAMNSCAPPAPQHGVFARQQSPGNSGRIQNLFHRQGDRLAMRIETQSAAEPEQPFLFSVENRKLIRVDQFLPRILGNAPRIVRGAFHGRKQLNNFLVRDAALAYESPAQVENFSSHMFDSDRTHVLARAAG